MTPDTAAKSRRALALVRLGDRAAVAVFATALDDLECATIKYLTLVTPRAASSVSLESRQVHHRRFPRPRVMRPPATVATARRVVSRWQEFLVRNGLVKIKTQEIRR